MSQPYGRSVAGAAGSSTLGMAPSLVTGFDVTVVRGPGPPVTAPPRSALTRRSGGAGSAGVTHRCLSREAGGCDGRPTDGC
jgi:hypothetical protein